jgi:predicted nucleic acid-binding protein
MCIVIDTNTWAEIFDASSTNHADFKPVKDWIIEGKGKVVYGGNTYIAEIPSRFRKLLKILNSAGKTVSIPNEPVNAQEEIAKNKISHPDFDDPHIVALIIVSKCRLISTNEKRAIPYFKDEERLLYPKKILRPKIYHCADNKDLLIDKNIAKICLPCIKSSKTAAKTLIERLK